MNWRIGFQIFEHFFAVFSRTVIIRPACTSRKFVVPQHIQNANTWKSYLCQIRSNRHCCANQKATVGFEGTASINRSEWGLGGFVPLVSDSVDLTITVAFEKQ